MYNFGISNINAVYPPNLECCPKFSSYMPPFGRLLINIIFSHLSSNPNRGFTYSALLLTVIGTTSFSNSSIAMFIGSSSSVSMSTGAPIAICSARAPIMRAFSYFVYSFSFSVKKITFPYLCIVWCENGVAEI